MAEYLLIQAINGLVIGIIYAVIAVRADGDLLDSEDRELRPWRGLT